ncbi:MAG: AAA family ATPase, partial [Bdellovibrio sp.]|nr:AAA family ATPase [Bdellovibrio sp.]
MSRILSRFVQNHWKDPKNLIQVLMGPRQVGKTTLITELTEHLSEGSFLYASADLPSPPTPDFIISHWSKVRALKVEKPTLVLDEIQKIPRWSETVKMLWDEDQRHKKIMNIWLLGSSAILIEKGLSESLTGRFELNFLPHWIFLECEKTF